MGGSESLSSATGGWPNYTKGKMGSDVDGGRLRFAATQVHLSISVYIHFAVPARLRRGFQ